MEGQGKLTLLTWLLCRVQHMLFNENINKQCLGLLFELQKPRIFFSLLVLFSVQQTSNELQKEMHA
jgi:hypothetical protein